MTQFPKTQYVRYTPQRNMSYQIITSIEDRDVGRVVIKRAASESSQQHILNLEHNASVMRSSQQIFEIADFYMEKGAFVTKYVEGKALDQILFSALSNNDELSFNRLINDYCSRIRSLPQKFCLPFTCEPEETRIFTPGNDPIPCLQVGNLDLIFENIVIDYNKKYYNIDYEWLIPLSVPIDFVLYRSIIIFLNKYNKYIKSDDLKSSMIRSMKIDIPVNTLEQWEREFSSHVHDGSLLPLHLKMTRKPIAFGDWMNFTPYNILTHMYYSDGGDFTALQHIATETNRNSASKIRFDMRNTGAVKRFRWDPCEGLFCAVNMDSCLLEVKTLDGDTTILRPTPDAGYSIYARSTFFSTDPQIYFESELPIHVDHVILYATWRCLPYSALDSELVTPLWDLYAGSLSINELWENTKITASNKLVSILPDHTSLHSSFDNPYEFVTAVEKLAQNFLDQYILNRRWTQALETISTEIGEILRSSEHPLSNAEDPDELIVVVRLMTRAYQVIENKQKELTDRHREVSDSYRKLTEHMIAVESSLIWRVSKPLRRIWGHMRQIFKNIL